MNYRPFVAIVILLLAFTAARCEGQDIKLVVDGKKIKTDVPPMMSQATIFVPLRGVLERFKAAISYEKSTGTVRAARGNHKVVIVVNSTKAKVNGRTKIMPIPAFIHHERTLVPLRFMSEALGCSVRWEPSSAAVYVDSQGGGSSSGGDDPLKDDIDVKDVDDFK
ncbi:MAG: copper amine oxidase N-terminal domain-containing protein [Candidatus Eremiobacteraeota bacterium]|nr:copper amine oxidase N-terminal domain-containing protein [Candidatus Eremiobacteraeota bacterium]